MMIARHLRREIYRLSLGLPEIEKFSLASQLRRAATSITANIAEGFGRYSYQENLQFCRQARGPVYEIRDHLITCVGESYVSPSEGEALDRLCQEVTKLLDGYVRPTLELERAATSHSQERQ